MGNSTSESAAVHLFNTLIGQYSGTISAIQQGSVAIGNELFFALGTITIAILGINRLLSKSVDATDTYIEFIKLIIYLNVFLLFINNFPNLLPSIVSSFKQAAFYMGGLINKQTNTNGATNFTVATNPGEILNLGVNLASTVLDIANKQTHLINFGIALIGVATAAVLIYCFGSIAIQIVIIEIKSKILLSAALFFLAFSANQWTREYATRYIAAFFSIGIQMMFTYLLVGIGVGLANTWINTLTNVGGDQFIAESIAVVMATYVYYKISMTLPGEATSYLAGGMAISPGKPMGIGTAAAIAGAGIIGTWKFGQVSQIKSAGMSKAWSAADKAATAKYGEKKGILGRLDHFGDTIKTLGAADGRIQKQIWDGKVDKTYEGQVAQNIVNKQKEEAASKR